MRDRWSWRLLPMALALHAQAVHGQTSDTGSRLPDLLVTRLQEPATRGPGNDQVAPARSAAASPLPATSLDERQPGASLDGPRRISMTVARPMPLGDLLLLLVNGTPFSLVDGEAAPGATFIGDLKDLTMRQAIEAVLFPRSLDYDCRGHSFASFRGRVSTRLLQRELSEHPPQPATPDSSRVFNRGPAEPITDSPVVVAERSV